MFQNWERLTFVHWRYPAPVVAKLLPRELELDTFDHSAWIGLVPFEVAHLRSPRGPSLPWLSHFPETNLRTYVRNAAGEAGVWFFTLEAARLLAVWGARITFGLPYHWAKMRIEADGREIRYTGSRPNGQSSPVSTDIHVQIGEPIEPAAIDTFLTARFRLYSVLRGNMVYADVEHGPWPLFSARLIHCEQTVTEAFGLPAPPGDAICRYSPGVQVRVGPIRINE